MACLFCKIAAKEIPATIRYEDDDVVAFDDIHPKAPTHVLIVPRRHLARVQDFDDGAIAGALFIAARRIAISADIAETGYRLVVNNGSDGGQEVEHLHLHLIGGKKLGAMA
ncbi:MAG: histidine triad nucleotide-binding protein [bacterium]|nr:histidine triad nucleotide-binding protein [bacterium]